MELSKEAVTQVRGMNDNVVHLFNYFTAKRNRHTRFFNISFHKIIQ